MIAYIDFFHARPFLKENNKYYKQLLQLSEMYEIYFVKEQYTTMQDGYKQSFALSKKAFGVYIPLKDIRNRISANQNGCNTHTSNPTINLMNEIKNKGYDIIEIEYEYDTFVNSEAGSTARSVLAISNDIDIYKLSGFHNNLSLLPFYDLDKAPKKETFDEFLFSVFLTFIFGNVKNNVYGVVYKDLILDYDNFSEKIVDNAPKTEILQYINRSIVNYKKAPFLHDTAMYNKQKTIDYLTKCINDKGIIHLRDILLECGILASKFVQKYAPEFSDMFTKDYINYISVLCYHTTLFE